MPKILRFWRPIAGAWYYYPVWSMALCEHDVQTDYRSLQPAERAIREVEDYTANLDGVDALELTIVPDASGGDARASLISLRLE